MDYKLIQLISSIVIMSVTGDLICTSCEVQIGSKDEYRKHFQSEFHKYNCKRKLVSLAPISLQDFEEKRARRF